MKLSKLGLYFFLILFFSVEVLATKLTIDPDPFLSATTYYYSCTGDTFPFNCQTPICTIGSNSCTDNVSRIGVYMVDPSNNSRIDARSTVSTLNISYNQSKFLFTDILGRNCSVGSVPFTIPSNGTTNVSISINIPTLNSTLLSYRYTNGTVLDLPTELYSFHTMKANVKVEVVDNTNNTVVNILYPSTDVVFGGNNLDNPTKSIGPFNWTPNLTGTFKIRVITDTNVESKCTFSQQTKVSIVSSNAIVITEPDSDSDGVPDSQDLCPNEAWNVLGSTATSATEYNGCPFEYTKNCTLSTSSGGAIIDYDGRNLVCNYVDSYCSGKWCDNYFSFNGVNINQFNHPQIILLKPSKEGVYNCYNIETWPKDDIPIGSCNLRFNGNSSNYCTLSDSSKLKSGDSKKYYKYSKMLKKEVEEDNNKGPLSQLSQNITCSLLTPPPSITSGYFEFTKILIGPEYDNIIRDANGNLVENDSVTIGKLSCSSAIDVCNITTTNSSEIVNFTQVSTYPNNVIKIVKNDVNVRNDTIDPVLIALEAHKIELFSNAVQAKNFILTSYNVMTKFGITKSLNYDLITNTTYVNISLENIAPADRINLTIYMIVPKNIANSFNDISNINEGNGQFFVKDKDPIIGWYFNESATNQSVGFNVSGNNEGGTLIITQQPILFNEGELIINYRQNACNAGEVELFELEDLIDSKVYLAGNSKLYKVCITHLNSSVNLALGMGPQYINIMSYENASNASNIIGMFSNKVILSQTNTNLYWDVRVGLNNPNGNYSCIGSFKMVNDSSLFGDCGYNQNNRLWIHLGGDYNPPTTTLSYPNLAHTLKVTLLATEPVWESGVKSLSYRVVEDNLTFTNVNKDSVTFQVTCPNDWNCKKTVEFYSSDNAGNIEITKSQDLLLIDKGSACQNDCSAKPSPNRYLKECMNLNGCTYFASPGETSNQKGLKVAEACNYLVLGSWAKYNETHEILCPMGPFRESKFTNTTINLFDKSKCDHILKTPYPVFLDGEQIIMDIVSCISDTNIK